MTRPDATLFRNPPLRYLDVGTGEVAYRRVGTGPDVLFVHGWPVSSATFRLLLPHLSEHVTCHLVDLPGAGSSRYTADTPLSIENHIHSVRRVLDLLELDDVAVVGHDSGGMIARHAVAGDPRLRAMGLIDTEQSSGLGWRFRSFIAGRRAPASAPHSVGSRGGPGCAATASCSATPSPTATCSTASSTSSSSSRSTAHPSTARRRCGCSAASSTGTSTSSGRCTRGSRSPCTSCGARRTASSRSTGPAGWSATSPTRDSTVIPGAGLFSHEERPAEVGARCCRR